MLKGLTKKDTSSSATAKNKNKNTETIVRAQKKNEEDDEYLFKNTTNAGGKGGVLDRENPMLEEKFAVIGEGEHEYVRSDFILFSVSVSSVVKTSARQWSLPTFLISLFIILYVLD